MLHPSYSELMDILNDEAESGSRISSRYMIVIAASKRARQLIDGARAASGMPETDKAVSQAVNEMMHGKIKIRIAAASDNKVMPDQELMSDE